MKKNKMPNTEKFNSGRETRVLLEEIRNDVKRIAEGHTILNRKFDEQEKIIRQIDANYFKLQMDVESIKSRTGTIEIKLDRIERELGTVKNAVMDISAVIKDHERRMAKLEEKVQV